jgi:hypothetical protein
MANPDQSPAHGPGRPDQSRPDQSRPDQFRHGQSRPGALTHTARIAGRVIAESHRLGDLAAAEADRLTRAVEALTSTLGGGPPAEIAETLRRAQTAASRIEHARTALHESAEALGAFVNRRI